MGIDALGQTLFNARRVCWAVATPGMRERAAWSQALLRERATRMTLGFVGVPLAALYYFFSLRTAGHHTTIFTLQTATPAFIVQEFGLTYFLASITLDVLIAFLTSVMIAAAIVAHRARKAAGAGAACSTASVGLAVATFGCPACTIPIAGTLGAAASAGTLPMFGLEFKLLAMSFLGASLWRIAGRVRAAPSSGPSRPLPTVPAAPK